MAGWSFLEESKSHRGPPLIISTFVIRKKHGNLVYFPESFCVVSVALSYTLFPLLGHPIIHQYLLKFCCRQNTSIRFHEIQRNKQKDFCFEEAHKQTSMGETTHKHEAIWHFVKAIAYHSVKCHYKLKHNKAQAKTELSSIHVTGLHEEVSFEEIIFNNFMYYILSCKEFKLSSSFDSTFKFIVFLLQL